MDERAYLIVYHTYPGYPSHQWFDKLWDPDLRAAPFTWGVCRPDVRTYARVGSHLFFVAYHMEGHKRQLDERYYFAAHFRVGERISHVEAVRRFPDRSNIILEHLPNETSLATRLRAYLAAHEATLNWADREQIFHILASGDIPDLALCTVEEEGETLVHAYGDDHTDWCYRVERPYLVSTLDSRVIRPPIPYASCAATCHSLPPVDVLQSPRSWKHAVRRIDDEAAACLAEVATSCGLIPERSTLNAS